MSRVKIVGQVCMYNEVEKGNLDRCLDNLLRYCSEIVIYDDASTDNSVEIASRYTPHIIRGEVNNQSQELAHKQLLLEKGIELGATHLFWLDADEVLDREGTVHGLRNLCRRWPGDVDAFSFREVNLWRSQTWWRLDSLFDKARFVRLWRVVPDMSFNIRDGVHLRLYPANIKRVKEAPFSVIHYGFWDYKKMMVKIGAHLFNQKELEACAYTNWILDERDCRCVRLPDEHFPPGCLPPNIWGQPQPKSIHQLVPYGKVPEQNPFPLVDPRNYIEWVDKHNDNYHGDYDSIFKRNRGVWLTKAKDPINRHNIFRFNPEGKVVFDWGCGGGWDMLDCLVNGAELVVGLEVNKKLLDSALRSFQELKIPESSYRFVDLSVDGVPNLPAPDIIYSKAVFMHIPWWQSKRHLEVIHELLKPEGEAHIQFYQYEKKPEIMFFNGVDKIKLVQLESRLYQIGFDVVSKRLAEGEGILPVWKLYHLKKR